VSVHEVFPYLRVRGANAAIEFYKHVFGARERFRLTDPSDGRVGHAELELGPNMVLMLSDEYPEMGIRGPAEGGASMGVHLHVDDCDAIVERAVAAGAELTMPPSDQFYGERSAKIVDPWGCEWMIGHSLEQVEPEEMQRRWDAMAR
jgi:PhnB protein